MNITLKQLRAFASVHRLGSFVKAAETMFVTQAALSHLLRELEKNLGFRLFHRTTHMVRLTQEGEVFLPYVTRLLTNLEGAQACAAALAQGKRGILRVCTTETLVSTDIMSVVVDFQEQNPAAQIILSEAQPDTIIHHLEAERVDVAIGPQRITPDSIDAEPLFTARLVALCVHTHPLAQRKSLNWKELVAYPLLLTKGGTRLSIAADIQNIIDLEQAQEIAHLTTLLAQTAIGNHVGITTSYVAPFLPVYQLVAIPLRNPIVRRKVMLYTSRKYTPSGLAMAFISHIKRSYRGKS